MRWMAKLVARLRATAALWIRIQTSLKNIKYGRQKQRIGNKEMFMPQSCGVFLVRISFGAYPHPAFLDNKHLNPVRSLTIK